MANPTKRPLLQGGNFQQVGCSPIVAPDGQAFEPAEFNLGIPKGIADPVRHLTILAAKWTREKFDRPSLIVVDTDSEYTQIYVYECNSFHNYAWTANVAYKARDYRRGQCIFIGKPGWYTFWNVGTGGGSAVDLKCRVFDMSALNVHDPRAIAGAISGYNKTRVAWPIIGATNADPAALHVASVGGGVLPAQTIDHDSVTVGNTTTAALAANAARTGALFINDSDEIIYIALGVNAVLNEGIRLNANGGNYQIDNRQPFVGAVNAICTSGGKNLLVTEWE